MPDARFPDRWLNDRRIRRLNLAEFRAFVVSLAWSVSNKTDGVIEPADLPLINDFNPDAIPGLTSKGVWSGAGPWVIVDFNDTQTSAAQMDGLADRRFKDRERKAKERQRRRGDDAPSDMSRDMSRDSPQDVSTVTHRQGQDRTGIYSGGTPVEQIDPQTGEVTEPPNWNTGYPICSRPGCTDKLLTAARQNSGVCFKHSTEEADAA